MVDEGEAVQLVSVLLVSTERDRYVAERSDGIALDNPLVPVTGADQVVRFVDQGEQASGSQTLIARNPSPVRIGHREYSPAADVVAEDGG